MTLVYLCTLSLQNLAIPQDFAATILMPLYSMLWNLRVSRAGPMPFHWTITARSLFVFYCFLFLFFLYMGWYSGVGVFELIGCKSLSPILALPTFKNSNDNNNATLSQTTKHAVPPKHQLQRCHAPPSLGAVPSNT